MHRIDHVTAEADKFGAGKDGFTEGTPGVTAATVVTDDWADGVQEEICNVIEGNGGTLVKGTRNQMLGILRNLVGATGSGVGCKATGGTPNGNGLEGVGTGTGTGVDGTATDGYGVKAESDTSSPAKAALRIVPQDDEPSSSPAAGDVSVVTTKLRSHNGTTWDRQLAQSYASIADSSDVTNTGTETTFDETYDIPLDTLKIGSTIRIKALIDCSTHSSTLNAALRVKLDAASPMTIQLGLIDNSVDMILVDVVFTMRSIGGTGAYVGQATANLVNTASGSSDDVRSAVSVGSTVDTTQAITVGLSWDWTGANPADVAKLIQLVVDVN